MTERVLTTRELNRAVLARQLLLSRARIPLTRALEQVTGLQAQYAPSAYVGLWSRLEGFRRAMATTAEGLKHAVQRYLGGFGPASTDDLASWCGLPPTMLRPVVACLHLPRFRDEQGGELLDLPRAPLPDPDMPAPVRFLPTWDATLLVHARRTQILPEPYRPRVFNTRTPHSVSTFLVDGQVAGTWRYEKGRVRLEPFRALTRMVRHALEDEAASLAAFHAAVPA
ncbi:MAG: DNA glycosylase AlkZ-like family protein [Armatimonadota bacterium]